MDRQGRRAGLPPLHCGDRTISERSDIGTPGQDRSGQRAARALSLALPTDWQIPKELESREVDEEEADDGHGVLGSDDENPDRLILTNPTGEGIRGQDRRGAGHFGAPRGGRRHTGVDFKGTPGQTVHAILGGKIVKYGYPYHGDMQRRYVMIEDPRGYVARHLYVKMAPSLKVGQAVAAGEVIGTLQSLGDKDGYSGITEHVHVDIQFDGVFFDPTPYFDTV